MNTYYMFRSILVLIFCGSCTGLSGQGLTPADSLGARFDTELTSPAAVAKSLCRDLTGEENQARAIFSWLAHHINYDLEEARNSRPERIMYRTEAELQQLLAQRRRHRMQEALRTRKGVCHHYADLFVDMCRALGLQAGTIDGYVIRHPDELGTPPLSSNHVWNWVILDGRKRLLDVTFAAGTANWEGSAFRQKYDPAWFDVPPAIMIQTHFPEQQTDQLLPAPLSVSDFASLPFFFPRSTWYRVLQWSPRQGIIRREETRAIRLHFARRPKQLFLIVDQLVQEVSVNWNEQVATIHLDPNWLEGQTLLEIGVEDAGAVFRSLIAWKLMD